MNKTGMNNPFDASVSLVTAQTVVKKSSPSNAKQNKEQKSTDKIKIFLACVPSLEDAKNDLKDIVDQVDESIKGEVQSFIEQIASIQGKVLEFTQIAISESVVSKKEPVATDAEPEASAPAPESISLSDILASRISDSDIMKLALKDVSFSGGQVITTDRSAGSKIRQIPDATR